jgi:hypothetical protein
MYPPAGNPSQRKEQKKRQTLNIKNFKSGGEGGLGSQGSHRLNWQHSEGIYEGKKLHDASTVLRSSIGSAPYSRPSQTDEKDDRTDYQMIELNKGPGVKVDETRVETANSYQAYEQYNSGDLYNF